MPIFPHAPATSADPSTTSALRHEGSRGPFTGSHATPPSVVVKRPEGNASVPSPHTKPFFSSKNRTACRPGITFMPTSAHRFPPSVVFSITPTDAPPAASRRPTVQPVFGVTKWMPRRLARVPVFCRSHDFPPSIECHTTPSSPHAQPSLSSTNWTA
nr:hypothetical protein [Frigoriglobus tundricola]